MLKEFFITILPLAWLVEAVYDVYSAAKLAQGAELRYKGRKYVVGRLLIAALSLFLTITFLLNL
jgi:hypothetical protein